MQYKASLLNPTRVEASQVIRPEAVMAYDKDIANAEADLRPINETIRTHTNTVAGYYDANMHSEELRGRMVNA